MEISKFMVNSPKGEITIIKLTNSTGAYLELYTLGAGITSVVVPDKNGNMADVVIGYKDYCDYFYDGPCAGKTPGRYANRIDRGLFSIDGTEYSLNINNGPNALHGGPEGFQNQIWNYEIMDEKVIFTYASIDGEENYPGNLIAKVIYSWNESNDIKIEYIATTDKKTIINLTNHAYWNLAGESSGSVLNHHLKLNSTKFLPTSDSLVPTGEFCDTAGTPMDFRTSKLIGKDINEEFEALKFGKGYDNCWVIDNETCLDCAVAELYDPQSGRLLNVYTTQPAVQIYTGNWLAGSPIGKGGRSYNDYDAVAIECQGMPDAPNHENFPSQILNVGDTYNKTIIFSLRIK